MKRISESFMLICFLAIMIAGAVFTVLREPATVSYYEYRMLAAFPNLNFETVKDGRFTAELERYLDDHAALRTTLLQWKVRIDLALHRPVVNNVIPTSDRLLPYLPYETPDTSQITTQAEAMADRLKEISDTVTEYGGYYCYVAVPCQYVYFEEDYPWFLENWSEYRHRSVFALSKALEQRDVAFLDMGAVFEEMGHPDEFGSRVDSHYTMAGAFETYRRIMDKITVESGLQFPILGPGDITFETILDEYLGSWERRLMNLVTREEHLSMALPKEPIPYIRVNNWMPSDSVVYSLDRYSSPHADYNFYMGGDWANTVIYTYRDELPTILIYGDSFTNALECIAYLSFDQMHSLDLRYYQDMSLEEYIQKLQPDIVICVRDYEALLLQSGNGGVY